MPDITRLRIFCRGMLHASGMSGMTNLTNEEMLDCADEKAWFCCGEVVMAGVLAGVIAVPAGLWFVPSDFQPFTCLNKTYPMLI